MDAGTSSAPTSRYISAEPTAIAQGAIHIDHPQLRDLVVCPHEQGVVIYPLGDDGSIVEQNLNLPNAPTRTLVELSFTPSSVTALALGPNDQDTLLAAGGSECAELHLSYHEADGNRPLWKYGTQLPATLNNSVLLTRSNQSSAEPRVGVTNNDHTFRLYDISTRRPASAERSDTALDEEWDSNCGGGGRLTCVGALKLDTCANYATMAPSGRMLLTVGDSQNVYLHSISGSSRSTFHPLATIPFPPPVNTPPHFPTHWPSMFTAAFATAWSKDGSKYAVGTQEGVVAIYDIRSTKPVKVIQTNKLRGMDASTGGVAANGQLWNPTFWFNRSAPPWSVRCVKFGGDENGVNETLVFSEHTSVIHVLDGKTFEHEEVISVPAAMQEPPPLSPPMNASFEPHLDFPLSFIQLDLPPAVPVAVTTNYNFPISSVPPLSYPPSAPSIFAEWEDSATTSGSATQQSASPLQEPDGSHLEEDEGEIPSDDEDSDEPRPSRVHPRSTRRHVQSHPKRKPNTVLSNGYLYERPQWEYSTELDIAGVCFDPSGKWLYTATANGVVEWGMKDRHG